MNSAVLKETVLQIAVKAVNNTAGPLGLVPTLLVFGALPRIIESDAPSPSIAKRAAAIRLASKEVRKLHDTRKVRDALAMRNGPSTLSTLNLPIRPGMFGHQLEWYYRHRLYHLDPLEHRNEAEDGDLTKTPCDTWIQSLRHLVNMGKLNGHTLVEQGKCSYRSFAQKSIQGRRSIIGLFSKSEDGEDSEMTERADEGADEDRRRTGHGQEASDDANNEEYPKDEHDEGERS